jgi:WD40 repeat protein
MNTAPANFYVTGGTLHLDAPSYVERKADQDLLEGLLAGEFCYILTSRQMGKSSLMVRTANKLGDADVVVLDLSALGQHMSREQWYNGLLAVIGQQLGIEDELEEFWNSNQMFSPVQRWFQALTSEILLKRSRPVVIFIDEIDVVRSLPFSTDEFFAAIRECYNRRARDPAFKRLTFCLLGVATPSDLVRDTNLTPFNVGRRIDLDDFTAEEAQPLARGLHAQPASARKLLKRVLYWTNGHPYLTQRLCQALARDPRTKRRGDVDRLCDDLFLSNRARQRDDNLIFVRDRMLRSEVDLTGLLDLYLKSWRRQPIFVDESSPLVTVLRLSGIVRGEGGRLLERNRIYHQVFDRGWVRDNLPKPEWQRQRAAYLKGVFRATAIASVVILVMIVMVLIAVKAKVARVALAQSYVSQAEARRASRSEGQRYESVAALEAAAKGQYPDRARLRDHMIASLALPDLKANPTKHHRQVGPETYEFNSDRAICAVAKTNGTIVVVTAADDQVRRSLPSLSATVTRLRFGADPTILLAEYHSDSSNQVVLWNWQSGARLFALPHGICGEAVDFSPDRKKLVIGQTNGQLTIYSLPEGKILNKRLLRLGSVQPRCVQAIHFDPSSQRLAESSLSDLFVQIWSIENLRKPLARLYHSDPVYDLSWHPAGEILATACGNTGIYLWDPARPEHEVKKLAGHEGKVTAVTFNHSGTQLASAGADETVRLWTPAATVDHHLIYQVEGEIVERLRFTANDQELLATSGSNQKHRLWDVFGEEYKHFQVHAGSYDSLKSIDFSPDGKWLATTINSRTTLWDAVSGTERAAIITTNAHAAGFSVDSVSLFVTTGDGLTRYDLSKRDHALEPLQYTFSCNLASTLPSTEPFRTMSLTADRTAAAISQEANVLLISIGTNCAPRIRNFRLGTSYQRLALHPGGKWLAGSTELPSSVDIWNLAGDSPPDRPITLHSSRYFAFSPDGKWFVTCWEEGFHFYRVSAWTNAVFDLPRKFRSHQQAPVAFCGSVVALAASRYVIELRELSEEGGSEPKLIATLEGPDRSALEMLAFSPDGRLLAAATADRTIQLWNLALLRDRLASNHLENGWPNTRNCK